MKTTSLSLMVLALSACGPAVIEEGSTGTSAALRRAPTAVQMNDVSILFPLAKSAAEIDTGYLAASSKGENGELLPSSIFDAVSSQVSGVNGPVQYADLRAVAVRLDPCFAQLGPVTDPSKCEHQMRVVFQSVAATASKSQPVTVGDSGFHAFYSLSADEFDATVKQVVALRLANSTGADLGALAVHPIMAKQGLSGAMASGVEAIVLQHAGEANLTRLTGFLGVFAQHTSWNFAAVDVDDGKPVDSPIVGLAGAPAVETAVLGTADTGYIALSFPATTTHDDVSPLLLATVEDASTTTQEHALDAALRIENPNLDSPNTIDCVSCHAAELARSVIAEGMLKLSDAGDVDAFVPDPAFVTKTDVRTSYAPRTPDGLALNLHAFSWDGNKPMVIERVINETAAIVAALNTGSK